MLEYYCKTCECIILQEQIRRALHNNRKPKYCSKACWGKRKRNYDYDDQFLNTINDFSAYFIGFFVADGHLDKNDAIVKISITDKQLIDDFVNITNYKKTIGFSTRPDKKNQNNKPEYTISYAGQVSKQIQKMGYNPGPKTGKEFIPSCITDKYFGSFLRGFIDGDGSWVKTTDEYGYTLCSVVCSNEKMLENILIRLKILKIVKQGHISCSTKNRKIPVHTLAFGHEDSMSLGNFIYKDATIKLERKYKIYLEGKEKELTAHSQVGVICSVEGCEENAVSHYLCKKHDDKHYRETHPLTDEQKEQRKINKREYYAKNPEHYREYAKNYRKNETPEQREKRLEKKRQYKKEHRDEINEYKREYRKRNPEMHKEMDKRKYEKGKDKALKRMKKYYEENKEKKLAYAEEYRNKNREEIRRKQREYYQKNKEKRKEQAKKAYQKKKQQKLDKPS